MNDEQTPRFYTVAIYMEDRLYGGPEEGGWYYTAGYPCMEPQCAPYLRGFDDEAAAAAYAFDLNEYVLPLWNQDRPEIGSVLSEGCYSAMVRDGFPTPYPATKPRYE